MVWARYSSVVGAGAYSVDAWLLRRFADDFPNANIRDSRPGSPRPERLFPKLRISSSTVQFSACGKQIRARPCSHTA